MNRPWYFAQPDETDHNCMSFLMSLDFPKPDLERPLLLTEIEHKFRKILVNLLIRSSEGIYP